MNLENQPKPSSTVKKQFAWQQVALLVAGLVVFVLLLNAEKTPPLNNRPRPEMAAEVKPAPAQTAVPNAPPPDEKTAEVIEKLTQNLKAATTKSDSLAAYDQLTAAAIEAHRPDLAAPYQEAYYNLKPTTEMLIKTANLYRDAASMPESGQNPEWETSFKQKAVPFYEKYLAQHPEDVDAEVDLAIMMILPQSPMQGIQKLVKIAADHPENFKASMELGKFSIRSGQFGKAIERLKNAVTVEPKNWEAHFYLGYALENSGDKEAAVKEYQQAEKLTTDPNLKDMVQKQMQKAGGAAH